MKGNLEHFSPTQILNLVSLSKKSGTLNVNNSGAKAALSFKDGKLIFVSMDQADGSLTSVLQGAGKITKEQASSLSAHAEKHGDKQLGLLLIQKGYITRADIVKCIKRHALMSVNEFANWNRGDFVFDLANQPGDDRILVPLDLENIIIQIARVQQRDDRLEEEIPSLDVALKFADKSKINPKELQLSKEEWAVIKFVKSGNTIRMIAKSLKMNDKEIRRVVGSLREAGLVELNRVRPKEQLSEEQKTEKKALIGRLITRISSI